MGKFRLLSAVLAAASMLGASAQERYEYNEFYYQRSSLFSLLPVKQTDIVFLGDSQTNGCEWSELLGNPDVKNRGISSDVIQGFADRVDPIIAGKPRKIFILGGVNDVSHNLTADSIAAAMESLIVRIKEGSPSTRVYLQSLLPINNDFGRYKGIVGKERVIVEANKLLREMACRQGVTWIDLYSRMADADGKLRKELTNDGLHLLGEGYLVWRDAVIPYVEE